MWMLISRMKVKRTHRRLGRGVLTAVVVIATVTEVAMGLLPKPAAAGVGMVGLDDAAVGLVEAPGAEGAVAESAVVKSAIAEDLHALAHGGRSGTSL